MLDILPSPISVGYTRRTAEGTFRRSFADFFFFLELSQTNHAERVRQLNKTTTFKLRLYLCYVWKTVFFITNIVSMATQRLRTSLAIIYITASHALVQADAQACSDMLNLGLAVGTKGLDNIHFRYHIRKYFTVYLLFSIISTNKHFLTSIITKANFNLH